MEKLIKWTAPTVYRGNRRISGDEELLNHVEARRFVLAGMAVYVNDVDDRKLIEV